MSQLTTEQLLLLIDEAEGPQSVALGGTDLSGRPLRPWAAEFSVP